MARVPDEAVELAKRFEGLRLTAYHCPAGYPTIGYGHKLSDEKNDDLGRYAPLTEAEADQLLRDDLAAFSERLDDLVEVQLSDRRWAALLDFIYNLGTGAFKTSRLRKVVNGGADHLAPDEFRRWVFADGRRLPGLVARREAEALLWLQG